MALVLGVNAVFHDPSAALVIDGEIVAAAEEERFNRRKHGKGCVPFSTWEVPTAAMRWCLAEAGVSAEHLDAVAYSYDPALCIGAEERHDPALARQQGSAETRDSWDQWEAMRTMYAQRAEEFVRTALPGLRPDRFHHVPHHIAHAASCARCAPFGDSAVLVMDGRGETSSYLAGQYRDGRIDVLATQVLPQSVGLLWEEVTEHLGFRRSSDEYKVMALASYGDPERFRHAFDAGVRVGPGGTFAADRMALGTLAPRRHGDEPWTSEHADLAAGLQAATERLLVDLGSWLADRTQLRNLTMAGGVALNCVANSALARAGIFDEIWVQPAAGDAGTALGAALEVAHTLGDPARAMRTAALGRGWSVAEIEEVLESAELAYERPDHLADVCAEALAEGQVIGWMEGRSEFGPCALGHRSLLVDPRDPDNLQRMNKIKGREEFRPVAPMVLLERAAEIFDGPIPSPYMLFVHDVRPDWIDRIPAAVHVDGTARIQTVDRADEPLMAAVLDAFCARTGVPVLVNTSFNTAGRPIVDSPVDALECFGSGPIDLLVLAPFVVRRRGLAR